MSPSEAVANVKRVPGRINIGLALLYTALNVGQFFILPLFLFPSNLRRAWVLLPIGLLNNPYWPVTRGDSRSISSRFPHQSAFRPDALGYVRLAILYFALEPFAASQAQSHADRTEFYDRGEVSILSAAAGYYFQILIGLYLVEILSPLLFSLPRPWLRKFAARGIKPNTVSAILMQSWTRDQAISQIRMDGFLIVAWFGTALYCYGSRWPLLAAIIATRGLLISFLDNVYHYRTPVGDIFYAKNLWLPRPTAAILLNFNLHGVHHLHPAVPWRGLPLLFREAGEIYQGHYFAAAARQLCSPVALQDLPRIG
jgi:hypothetical protein